MAFTINALFVSTAAPEANRNSSGVAEQRGAMTMGRIDITSYTASGEIVPAAALGLGKLYNAVVFGSESDTYAPRAVIPASNQRSGTFKIDTAGSGTEVSGATDVGEFAFIAWGEMLGSGTN